MGGYKPTYLLGLLLLTSFTHYGCKKPPSLSADNSSDPLSENFEPASPFNLTVSLFQQDSLLVLDWEQNKNDADYLDGYLIYKRKSVNKNFELINEIQIPNTVNRGNTRSFSFTDTEKFNGLFAQYKIASFVVQNEDTAFSEPVFISYDDIEFEIHYTINPFVTNPYQIFHISSSGSLPKEIILDLYTKGPSQSTYNPIASVQIGEADSLTLPLDVYQPENTEYYYRLRKNDTETDYQQMIGDMETLYFHISNTTESLNQTTFQIKPIAYIYEKIGGVNLDNISIRVYNTTGSDSILFFSTQQSFDNSTTTVTISDLNNADKYTIFIEGIIGSYSSSAYTYDFEYRYLITSDARFSTVMPVMYFPKGNFNSTSDQLIFGSDHSSPVIIDLETRESIFPFDTETNGSVINNVQYGEYAHLNDAIIHSTSANKVKIYDSASQLVSFEIPNFTDPNSSSTNLYPVDFEVISDKEMFIVYGDVNQENRIANSFYITKWNNVSQSHTLMHEMHGNFFSNEFKISYKNNLIALYHAYNGTSDSNLKKKITIFDASGFTVLNELDLSHLVDLRSIFDIEISNKGEDVNIYSQHSIFRFDIHSLEVFSSLKFAVEEPENSIRGFSSAENSRISCFNLKLENGNEINCADGDFDHAFRFHRNQANFFGVILNESGNKLTALSYNQVFTYEFETGWIIDN